MSYVSNQEKIDIINQHLSGIERNDYSINLHIMEENLKKSPNPDMIKHFEDQLKDSARQIDFLNKEIEKLKEEEE